VFDVFEVKCMHTCMHLVCLRLYLCIWCIHGYIYAYMSIFYFEMQGLKEKQKKSEKLGALCRVYAHGKGPFWSLCSVHTHGKEPTWRSPVHRTAGWVCLPRALPCGLPAGHTATSNATAHGNEVRTAMPLPTAKEVARQRP
jgi:hypothetical protein